MKKKILALCLVVVLAITAVTGATLAYFTDTDSAKNVMVTGNVKIYQNEQQRTLDTEVDNDAQHQSIRKENDDLEDFEDNKKLAPYTGTVGADGKATEYGESATINGVAGYEMFDNNKNAIDKIVTVTNEGTEECYVRTLFAWEMLEVKNDDGSVTYLNPLQGGKYISTVCEPSATGAGMPSWTYDKDNEFGLDVKAGDKVTFELNGTRYMVAHYYYPAILKAGETTQPSLKQFYLNANIDNEFYDMVGREYEVLVLSQATQTEGFKTTEDGSFKYEDAKNALETAFGVHWELSATKLAELFKDVA